MKFAVLGLGSAGRRHAANLAELGHEVVGFDPEAAAGEFERADSEAAAIAVADAVVVASPNVAHARQVTAAIEAGSPTLVEKPLATRAPDAEALVALVEGSGVFCSVAMNLRFHAPLVELKRMVDAGELGEIRLARASFGNDLRQWRPQADYRQSYSARADLGGGVVLDAIHELDYLAWLLGPVETVSAVTGTLSDLEIDVEDTAVAALRFASGALGTVDVNFFEPGYRRGCLLVGAQATAEWDWAKETIVVRSASDQRVVEVPGDVADTYRAEAAEFANALEGGSPATTAAEGLAAVRVADAIKASSETGETVRLPT